MKSARTIWNYKNVNSQSKFHSRKPVEITLGKVEGSVGRMTTDRGNLDRNGANEKMSA
jgi:hypothetical protein